MKHTETIHQTPEEIGLRYQTICSLARRAKYKLIEKDSHYCHFVFQGVRVESIRDEKGYIVCLCKGGVAKETNKIENYNSSVFYITDGNKEIIYDLNKFSAFSREFAKYFNANQNWIAKDRDYYELTHMKELEEENYEFK